MNIIFGAMYDENMTDYCKVTVIATGLEDETLPTNKPLSPYSTFSNKYVKPVNPNLNLKSAGAVGGDGLGAAQGAGAPVQRKPLTGINSPGDIRSNVADKPLKIPDFLQKK